MRATTISFSKNKAKLTNTKESQVKARLEELDRLIYNNFNSPDIAKVSKEYENLKMELQSIYDQKGKAVIYSDLNVDGSKTKNAPPNISLTSKKEPQQKNHKGTS